MPEPTTRVAHALRVERYLTDPQPQWVRVGAVPRCGLLEATRIEHDAYQARVRLRIINPKTRTVLLDIDGRGPREPWRS